MDEHIASSTNVTYYSTSSKGPYVSMTGSVTRKTFGRLRRFARGDGVSIALQPISDLETGSVVGFEALARFDGEPVRSPAAWFRDASEVGVRHELELATVRAALAVLSTLPEDTYLTVNASPDVATSKTFADAIAAAPAGRLIVEITEHAPVADYDVLNLALQELRDRGARVAIDDAGAGFANMTHILRLNVDLIKLDIELTRHIDIDAKRKALVASLVKFAGSVGAQIVAEGIESEAELRTLRSLGVRAGQGFHLGRPQVLQSASLSAPRASCRSAARALADAASVIRGRRPQREPSSRIRGIRRVALVMIAMLLWPVAAAYAENALPGSTGWWLKRRIEDARLVVALDRQTEIRLQLDFARRRLNEVSELLARGDASRTAPALGDYQRRVSAVHDFLPNLNPRTEALQQRIQSDLADYIATLAQQSNGACGEGGSDGPCRELDASARRSKDAFDQVRRIPPRAPAAAENGPITRPVGAKTRPSPERQSADPRADSPKKRS